MRTRSARRADDQPTGTGPLLGGTRVVVGLTLFALVGVALARSWPEVRTSLANLDPIQLIGAEMLAIAGLLFSALTWRQSAAEVGAPLPLRSSAKIYLVGQLGKYVPGSVWALAVQTELGKTAGVPRHLGAVASMIAIAVNVATGAAIGLALSPVVAPRVGSRPVVVAVVIAVAVAVLTPPVLRRIVGTGLRLIRRPQLGRGMTWSGTALATLWSCASWSCYGASLFVLAVGLGSSPASVLVPCLAAMPLAMTAGFLALVAPSGIGVREAVIVAALVPVIDRPDALALALVTRALFTLADLLAALAVAPIQIAPRAGIT